MIGAGRGADQIIDALPGSRVQTKNLQGEISGIVGFMDDNNPREPYWGWVNVVDATIRHPEDFDAAIISVSTSIEFRQGQFDDFKRNVCQFHRSKQGQCPPYQGGRKL